MLGMGLSYILLLTAFYVDNGPFLPLWRSLPALAYWLGPSMVGLPILVRALLKHRVPLPVSWTPEGDVMVWLPRRSSILVPLCDRVS